MGSSGEAAYLEALKQEKPLPQKSCEADVQVGLPAAGQNMCCRCQAVRWRLHMLQWQLQPRHLAGLMGMSLTCLAQATGSALILLDASAKAQGNKKTTSKSKITKTCSAWCLERAAAGIGFRIRTQGSALSSRIRCLVSGGMGRRHTPQHSTLPAWEAPTKPLAACVLCTTW